METWPSGLRQQVANLSSHAKTWLREFESHRLRQNLMVRWQIVYASDCKPGLGRLNSYPDLQKYGSVAELVYCISLEN